MDKDWKAKVTSKGQVTIPADVRKNLQIEEGDFLIFEALGEFGVKVKVQKTNSLSSLKGSLSVESDANTSMLDMEEIRREAYNDISQKKHALREDEQ